MIYFKTISLIDPDKQQVEKAIRKVALRRDQSFDLTSSQAMAGTDKLFLGRDTKNETQFTRIRYYIEGLLPKLILTFPNTDNGQYYKIRLSLRSSVTFCYINALLLLVIILLFTDTEDDHLNGIVVFVALSVVHFSLILLEITLTKKAINTAIIRSQQAVS